MDKNAFDWYKIPKLGYGVSASEYGVLVFCKTRVTNEDFFNWYILNIVVPIVDDMRRLHPKETEGKVAWLCHDGEALQLPCYTKDENLNILREKIFRSRSFVHQERRQTNFGTRLVATYSAIAKRGEEDSRLPHRYRE
jgi:hypothetical protein